MKIAYKNGKLIFDGVIGIIAIALGVQKMMSNQTGWMVYLLFIFGVIYLVLNIYRYSKGYLVITEDSITFIGPPAKTFKADEITKVQELSKGYIIKSGSRTMRVVKGSISTSQFSEVENFIINVNKNLTSKEETPSPEGSKKEEIEEEKKEGEK